MVATKDAVAADEESGTGIVAGNVFGDHAIGALDPESAVAAGAVAVDNCIIADQADVTVAEHIDVLQPSAKGLDAVAESANVSVSNCHAESKGANSPRGRAERRTILTLESTDNRAGNGETVEIEGDVVGAKFDAVDVGRNYQISRQFVAAGLGDLVWKPALLVDFGLIDEHYTIGGKYR